MNFYEALHQLSLGRSVVSNIGIQYKAEDIAPIRSGPHWAIISSKSGMTREEREGNWELA